MEIPEYAYCPNCRKIRLIAAEPLKSQDTTGRFLGGDLVCTVCRVIIATLYKPLGSIVKV